MAVRKHALKRRDAPQLKVGGTRAALISTSVRLRKFVPDRSRMNNSKVLSTITPVIDEVGSVLRSDCVFTTAQHADEARL